MVQKLVDFIIIVIGALISFIGVYYGKNSITWGVIFRLVIPAPVGSRYL